MPTTKKAPDFLSSSIFKILIGAAIAFIFIFILGGILSNSKGNLKNNIISLKLHVDNISSSISTYQPNVKSSELRGYSASLASVLSETSKDLTTYLEEVYEYKEKNTDEKIIANETALSEELEATLFKAKINGLLDRTYAHEMAYEISIILARESEIYNSVKAGFQEPLKSSYDSLANLYDKFNDFSEK